MLLIYSSDGALHIVYTKNTSLHISLEAELNRLKYHYVPKLEPPKQLKLFVFFKFLRRQVTILWSYSVLACT